MEEVAEEFEQKAETIVFLDHFRSCRILRQRGKVLYPLDEILLLCLLAVLAERKPLSTLRCFVNELEFLPPVSGRFATARPRTDHLGDILLRRRPGIPQCFPLGSHR